MEVMAPTRKVLLALFLAASTTALATDYTVGDGQGWTTGVDYDTWASDKSFKVGDTLLFQYGGLHTVDEVSNSNYESCSGAGNAITTNNDGSTKISLDAAGSRYFICGIPTHCSGGMKLTVATTSASSGATNPPATPTPSGGSSNTPPSDTTTPPPPAPSAKNTASCNGIRGSDAAVLGGLIGLGIALGGYIVS